MSRVQAPLSASFMKYLLNKFFLHKLIIGNNYLNSMQIITLKEIKLNLGFKHVKLNSKNFLSIVLFFKILTNLIPKFIKSKKTIISLKIKKGLFSSCYLVLYKKNLNIFLQLFLDVLNLKYLKTFKVNSVGLNNFSIILDSLILFQKIEFFFEYFFNLSNLSISFVTTAGCFYKNLNFLSFIGLKFNLKLLK